MPSEFATVVTEHINAIVGQVSDTCSTLAETLNNLDFVLKGIHFDLPNKPAITKEAMAEAYEQCEKAVFGANRKLRVVGCPTTPDVLTNYVFVSPQDFSEEEIDDHPYLGFKDHAYRYKPCESMQPGCIGLNMIQRRSTKLSGNEAVEVCLIGETDFCDAYSLEMTMAPVIKGKIPAGGIDLETAAKDFVEAFDEHLVCKGQEIVFDHRGCNFVMTVTGWATRTELTDGVRICKPVNGITKGSEIVIRVIE